MIAIRRKGQTTRGTVFDEPGGQEFETCMDVRILEGEGLSWEGVKNISRGGNVKKP